MYEQIKKLRQVSEESQGLSEIIKYIDNTFDVISKKEGTFIKPEDESVEYVLKLKEVGEVKLVVVERGNGNFDLFTQFKEVENAKDFFSDLVISSSGKDNYFGIKTAKEVIKIIVRNFTNIA